MRLRRCLNNIKTRLVRPSFSPPILLFHFSGAILITGPVPEGLKVARTPERLTKWLILGCLRVEHSVGQFTQANQTRHQRFVTPILYRHVTRRNDFVRVYRSRGLISLEDIDYLFHFPCTINVDWDTQAF